LTKKKYHFRLKYSDIGRRSSITRQDYSNNSEI